VTSLFHEIKIPMMDMKVHVYSNFGKIKIKIKSPSSMCNARFHPPKCRSKVQRMGMLYTRSSKIPSPFPNFQKYKNKKMLKNLKKGGQLAI
jgi:hypothetical protein